jgi:hypothetical protein
VRALLFWFLIAAAPAHAAAPAPLPAHWVSEHSEEDEADYRRPPNLRGIYGHGFSNPLNLAGDSPACRGDAAAVAAYIVQAGENGSEFWFYATAQQGVLFGRSVQVDIDRACSDGVRYSYQLHRAFIVDGMVQSMEVNASGEADQLTTRPLRSDDREYSGAFSPLHNLMARAAPRERGQRRNQQVAGLPAQCWVMSGIVWSSVCYSRARGATYGMILSTAAGDDERQMFGMAFDLVRADAELDGRLFELDRRWRGER